MWPITPRVLPISANAFVICQGKPISSAMAPMAPVTLTGMSLLRRSVAFRQRLEQLALLAVDAGALGDPKKSVGPRVAFGVGAMADAGHTLFSLAVVIHD